MAERGFPSLSAKQLVKPASIFLSAFRLLPRLEEVYIRRVYTPTRRPPRFAENWFTNSECRPPGMKKERKRKKITPCLLQKNTTDLVPCRHTHMRTVHPRVVTKVVSWGGGTTTELRRTWCGTGAALVRNGCGTAAERLRNGCGTAAERLRNGCGSAARRPPRKPRSTKEEVVDGGGGVVGLTKGCRTADR